MNVYNVLLFAHYNFIFDSANKKVYCSYMSVWKRGNVWVGIVLLTNTYNFVPFLS